jgi:parallel beta-helix repeat protein
VIDPGQRRNRVERNRANGNADDGIDVDAPGTRIARNAASGNGDLGIEAVPGVTDGGGNRASGNGNPLQCANVFCKTG